MEESQHVGSSVVKQPAPHEVAVAMDDLLVLDDMLALEGVQRVEERLPAGTSLGDHPAHSAGREGHRN